jgi:hypothetical protein
VVFELEPFDRFVYVMSVLEGYSDEDCSVLLGFALRDVIRPTTWAAANQSAPKFHLKRPINVGSEKQDSITITDRYSNCNLLHVQQFSPKPNPR